jgi:pSer/pThr/pTyr-binding forkhead associated (FHA) protein
MPRLIIKSTLTKNQRFELPEGETVIGRGAEDCQLVLPNVSVSRTHARVLVGQQGVTIEDLDSSSGVLVNGSKIDQTPLSSGDEIQVGKFSLVFLGDARADRFYKGRFVEYLPEYEPGGVMADDGASTFAMDINTLRKLQEDNHVVENAKLVLESNQRRFWFPEDRPLTLGTGGMVETEGWFTWGVVAELAWDGKHHTVRRQKWWGSVAVNGDKLQSRRPLRDGDRLTVGRSVYLYQCED